MNRRGFILSSIAALFTNACKKKEDMIGAGIGIPFGGKPSAADLYFSAAGITESVEKAAIRQAINSLKGEVNADNPQGLNLWDKLIYWNPISPSSFASSLFEVINRTQCTYNVGVTPSFSATGWSFNGTTQFMKTSFIPLNSLNSNNCSVFIYSRTNSNAAVIDIGASNAGGTTQLHLGLRNAGNTIFSAYAAASTMSTALGSSQGLYHGSVLGAASRSHTRNGSLIATSASALTGTLPAIEMYVGARNLAGAAGSFAAREYIDFGFGEGFSVAESLVFYNILKTKNNALPTPRGV